LSASATAPSANEHHTPEGTRSATASARSTWPASLRTPATVASAVERRGLPRQREGFVDSAVARERRRGLRQQGLQSIVIDGRPRHGWRTPARRLVTDPAP
jgi:hypothetical protein